MQLPFQVIVDSPASDRLEQLFAQYWPAYQRWIRRAPKRSFAECLGQLEVHMPELLGPFEQLHQRLGGEEEVGRFLTLYNTPPVVRACTQLIIDTDDGPALLRSYDHAPHLIDGLVLRAQWNSVGTLALTDCLWGALDGINEHGLAIALAFGGRRSTGNGFAAPLICRYILQTCATVAETREALARLPISMPYTFAVLDANADFVTAFLGPDTEAAFVTRRASANHQRRIDWTRYARFVQTADRQARAESLLAERVHVEQARRAFLEPPIWRTNYARASGTLYVAEYTPASRSLALHWPGRSEKIPFESPPERAFTVTLPDSPTADPQEPEASPTRAV